MAQRVFIKVMGFSDAERHALNTVFRLSEQRRIIYSLWQDDAPEPPRMALIDGQSYEARLELEAPGNSALKLIWVGAVAPAAAWRVFQRPLSWADVVKAMDDLFMPLQSLDFDLGFDTGSPDPTRPPPKRALIASASREERLYLRARLALADLTQADEAETGVQALELTRLNQYDIALLNFSLPDVNGWALLKQLTQARPPIKHLIFIKPHPSRRDRWRGWLGGARAFLDQPPHPGKLQKLLDRL